MGNLREVHETAVALRNGIDRLGDWGGPSVLTIRKLDCMFLSRVNDAIAEAEHAKAQMEKARLKARLAMVAARRLPVYAGRIELRGKRFHKTPEKMMGLR